MPYSTKSHYCHEEIRNKRQFDKKSFRSKIVGEHVIVFGCPKGQYNRKLKMCKVKPLVQKILHPKGEDKCLVSGVHFKSNPIPYKYQEYINFVLNSPYHFLIEALAVGFILYTQLREKKYYSTTKLSLKFYRFLRELEKRDKSYISVLINTDTAKRFILKAKGILEGKKLRVYPTTRTMIESFMEGDI